jgi:hypothetical protein
MLAFRHYADDRSVKHLRGSDSTLGRLPSRNCRHASDADGLHNPNPVRRNCRGKTFSTGPTCESLGERKKRRQAALIIVFNHPSSLASSNSVSTAK